MRNRYYFGKLLDVVHFDIEQDYFNYKRALINRMVLGYGVVCGLDVQLSPDGTAVRVSNGFAIDQWGREIIVPGTTRDLDLPTSPPVRQNPCDDGACYQLVICYYECSGSPEPSFGDECGSETCVPSMVQERYKLEWRSGKATEPTGDCMSELLSSDRISRKALAMQITRGCAGPACEPCLTLANLCIPIQGSPDIDITVRPIVYTNDLLYSLIAGLNRQNLQRPAK
jgi:hypothetical protein